jgi:ectoine hydroxylase-related dioxygenase (phytanoyl-CoA dioxygenase family)
VSSHRLTQVRDGIRSKDIKIILAARSDWFRDLWRKDPPEEDRIARYMHDAHDVDSVPVRVVELTGESGDVVLWHPGLLPAGAPNCADQPRFMLTHTALSGARAD